MANCVRRSRPGGACGACNACRQKRREDVGPACQQALRRGVKPERGAGSRPRRLHRHAARRYPASWPPTQWQRHAGHCDHLPAADDLSWPDHRTLNTRIAIGMISPAGRHARPTASSRSPSHARSELAERTVVLTCPPRVADFPSQTARSADAVAQRVRARFVDAIRDQARAARHERIRSASTAAGSAEARSAGHALLSLRTSGTAAAQCARTPHRPRAPASLVVFDGEPVLRADRRHHAVIRGQHQLGRVHATRRPKTWYLLNNGGWLAAPDAEGSVDCRPARCRRRSRRCPPTRNFADVKKADSRPRDHAGDAPTIFVSTTPAAIIVTDGPPQYVGDSRHVALQYVANTDAALFRDTAAAASITSCRAAGSRHRASTARGRSRPTSLPPDFARIPPNGPRGFVLVSVPGTPQAQEALLEAQIPQQATLNRATAKLDVVYAGAPQFVPDRRHADATYAANTSFNVIQRRRRLFIRATRAHGSPRPPRRARGRSRRRCPRRSTRFRRASPLYPCTYVRIYASTPDERHLRLHGGLHDELCQRGRRRLRHRLLLPALHLSRAHPDLLPVSVLVCRRDLLQLDDRRVGARRRHLRPVRRRRQGRLRLQPDHGRVGTRRRDLRPQRRRGRVLGVQPDAPAAMRTAARSGARRRVRQCELVQREHRAARARRSRTAMRTAAGARARSPAPTRPCTRKARATRRASAGAFTSTHGREGRRRLGRGRQPGRRRARRRAATSMRAPTATCTRRPTSGWQKYDNGSWNSVRQQPTTQRTWPHRPAPDGAQRSGQPPRPRGKPGGRATSQLGWPGSRSCAARRAAQRQQQFESMRGGVRRPRRRRISAIGAASRTRAAFADAYRRTCHACFFALIVGVADAQCGDARAARDRPRRADVAAIAADRRRQLRFGGGDARSARRQGLRGGGARASRTRRASR